MNHKWCMITLIVLGLLTRFVFFGSPNETVFDEVHFGKFVSGYYTHQYFFDIHPPLGKLMIAGFAKIFDFQPGFSFTDIGSAFPDKQYMALRFLPSLAGALLPLVIYLLILELGLRRQAAFFGGLMIVFENALLVQSRHILLDSFLLLFGFLSLLFYFKSRNYAPCATRYALLFGIFSGLAMSIKWTGLSFLALPLLIESVKIIRDRGIKRIFSVLLPSLSIALGLYSVVFIGHLVILNTSGPGDSFMTPSFQKTLFGNHFADNQETESSNIFEKFIELNIEMYKANQRIGATHPYSSQWYTWPLMARPIFYWVKDAAKIYLIGNPIIWWTSTAAILFSAILLLSQRIKPRQESGLSALSSPPLVILLAGYAVNILPFIGIKRVMFLYHYFTAYLFAIIVLAWLVSKNKNAGRIFLILTVASIAAFVFFAPLSYGLPISERGHNARIWFAGWE